MIQRIVFLSEHEIHERNEIDKDKQQVAFN